MKQVLARELLMKTRKQEPAIDWSGYMGNSPLYREILVVLYLY